MWNVKPDLTTPLAEQLSQLARAHRILGANGHANMSLGHMSLRDPQGRGFWLKRMGIGLEEVDGEADFILVDLDGTVRAGTGRRHGEWPIHAEIYRARADVHVVNHSHPFHAALFSAMNEPLQPLVHEGNYLYGKLAYYRRMPGLIRTPELGAELAAALGSANVILMQNHGVTVCGPDIASVGLASIFVERASHAQLIAAGSGHAWSAPRDEDMAEGGLSKIDMSVEQVRDLWAYFDRDLARRERART